MKRMMQGLFAMLLTFAPLGRAQNNPTPCPSMKAKNAQEALMMEGASNKKGCWERNSKSQLVFVAEGPDGYKPVLKSPPTVKVAPSNKIATVGVPRSLEGSWLVQWNFLGARTTGRLSFDTSGRVVEWICLSTCGNEPSSIREFVFARTGPAIYRRKDAYSYEGSQYVDTWTITVQEDALEATRTFVVDGKEESTSDRFVGRRLETQPKQQVR